MNGTNEVLGGGGFHHVAMRTADMEASVRFYTEALGFTPRITWRDGGQHAVMLDTGDGACLEIFSGGSGRPAGEGAILHFALRTADVDAAIERARAAGAEVTMEPQDLDIPSDPPTPVRIAFCKGPDSEIIELFHERAK